MQETIRLTEVIYDSRARDGTWCSLPYPNHPKGCPNFPGCPERRIDFNDEYNHLNIEWWATIEQFDLKAHASKMKQKHNHWTEKQCRCVLYWQPSVRKRLSQRTERFANEIGATIILKIPEANGVNVFATMAKHGLCLKSNPDIVYKIMLVGKVMD